MSQKPPCGLEASPKSVHVFSWDGKRRPGRKGGLVWARVTVFSCRCGAERHVILQRSKETPDLPTMGLIRNWVRAVLELPTVVSKEVKRIYLVDDDRHVIHAIVVKIEVKP